MARIMVYKEANLVLGSSLSPNNRGICKKTAILNNAQETPLASFAQNRLVPASVVAKKYYVVFLNEGGTVISSGYYEPGAALNDPGVPSKTGHTGVWNNGYTGYATGDVTYSPVYTPISYTITIVNDVTGTSTTEQWPYGSTPSLTPPTNSGYTFAGWSPAIQPVTGSATYHATYTADTVYHTVTFISDGSTYNTQSVAHGGYATNPGSPSKSGYTFTGWSPDVASTQINGDTTFTAQFTQAGPSTAGPFMVQGGLNSYFPWNAGVSSEDDIQPFGLGICAPGSYNRSGRLTVTGYKYNRATGVRTELPSGCYIDFEYLRYDSSNVEPPMVITLSDALYDQGWRLFHGDMYYANNYYQEPSRPGNDAIWQGEDSKKKAYIIRKDPYVANATICDYNAPDNSFLVIEGQTGDEGRAPLIGCPYNTPETVWVFTLSSEDATLGTYLGSYYPYITDNCYGSSNTYATNAANLNDTNIPACYTVLSIT